MDTVVEFSGRGVQDTAAAVPLGLAILAISVKSRSRATNSSEAFVFLTGGEVLDNVGPKANDTTVAPVSCPEGKSPRPPEGAAMVSKT